MAVTAWKLPTTYFASNDDAGYWWNDRQNLLVDNAAFMYGAGSNIANEYAFGAFDFGDLTGATINGIELEIRGYDSYGDSGWALNLRVTKTRDGNGAAQVWSTAKRMPASGDFGGTSAAKQTRTIGGATDLWGLTWTPADLAAAKFAVHIKYTGDQYSDEARLEVLRARVHYTAAGGTPFQGQGTIGNLAVTGYAGTLTTSGAFSGQGAAGQLGITGNAGAALRGQNLAGAIGNLAVTGYIGTLLTTQQGYALKATGLAADCTCCVVIDADGAITDLAGNTAVADAGVTTGAASWKGISRNYFQTLADGTFDFKGIRFGATKPPHNIGPASPGLSIFCALAGAGASTGIATAPANGAIELDGTRHPALIPTAATGATPWPGGGATKFAAGFTYEFDVDAKVYYGLESGALAQDASGTPSGFGSNGTFLASIGGEAGQGHVEGKYHIYAEFDRRLTLAEFQSLHNDWFGVLIDTGPIAFVGQGTIGQIGIAGAAGALQRGFNVAGAIGDLAVTGYAGELIFGAAFIAQGAIGQLGVTGRYAGFAIDAGGLLDGASDPDGDPLCYTLTDLPDYGALNAYVGGAFDYNRDAGYYGIDSFSYRVYSNGEAGNTGTIELRNETFNQAGAIGALSITGYAGTADIKLSKALNALWDVHDKQIVDQSLSLAWDTGGIIAKQLTAPWAARTVVADQAALPWDARNMLAASAALRWDSRASLTSALAAPYDIAARINSLPLALQWDQIGIVAASLQSPWDISTVAQIAQTLTGQYAIKQTIAAPAQLRWDTRAQIAASAVAQWRLRTLIEQAASARWDTRRLVAAAADLHWGALAMIAASLAAPYDRRALIAAQSALHWGGADTASGQLSAQWASRARAAGDIDIRWGSLDVIDSGIELDWQISGESIVAEPALTIVVPDQHRVIRMPDQHRVIRVRGDYFRPAAGT